MQLLPLSFSLYLSTRGQCLAVLFVWSILSLTWRLKCTQERFNWLTEVSLNIEACPRRLGYDEHSVVKMQHHLNMCPLRPTCGTANESHLKYTTFGYFWGF